MTSKTKPKNKQFKLNDEFEEKYGDITRIYTIGKALVLEHYTGTLIQSPYYSDDSLKTIKTLRNALVGNKAIDASFDIDGFLEAVAQILTRSIIQEAQQQESEAREEQQQRNGIQEEIKQLKEQCRNISSEQWISTLQEKHQNLYDVVQSEMPEIWSGLEFF